MNVLRKYLVLLIILMMVFTLSALFGCGNSDDDSESDEERDDSQDDDDAADDDVADDDTTDDDVTDDDDSTDLPDEVEIESANAPTEYTIKATFTEDMESWGEDIANYSVSSNKGALVLEAVSYDPSTKTATITTEKQKLGFTYTLTFQLEDFAPTQSSFLAADAATFWAIDFSDYSQYQLTANRAAVGNVTAIYVEDGYSPTDTDTTLTEFENNIYPTLTALFTTPPDFDQNGRITILGLNGGGYYGGYFSGTNGYSDEDTMDWWGLHSNEMEMIHIAIEWDTFMWSNVVPHEFQHLLYSKAHNYGDYWEYHDEGLAETAVHAVYGPNQGAINTYLGDYDGEFADGLSLVNWKYANYDNYALAYLFWTYVASRASGVDTFGEIFDLTNGNPGEVDTFLATLLGSDFATVQLDFMIANWVQANTGTYGYESMLSFSAASAPTVDAGTTSLDLEPYGGAIFKLSADSVDYPGTQGSNIVYAGIDSSYNVDKTAPFDIEDGALIVFNANQEYNTFPTEHSGPDQAAIAKAKSVVPDSWRKISPAWLDPPPIHPDNYEQIMQWRDRANLRIAEGWQPFTE